MLTLWRDEAERISKEYLESNLDPQIITIKGAKVSNFSGLVYFSIFIDFILFYFIYPNNRNNNNNNNKI